MEERGALLGWCRTCSAVLQVPACCTAQPGQLHHRSAPDSMPGRPVNATHACSHCHPYREFKERYKIDVKTQPRACHRLRMGCEKVREGGGLAPGAVRQQCNPLCNHTQHRLAGLPSTMCTATQRLSGLYHYAFPLADSRPAHHLPPCAGQEDPDHQLGGPPERGVPDERHRRARHDHARGVHLPCLPLPPCMRSAAASGRRAEAWRRPAQAATRAHPARFTHSWHPHPPLPRCLRRRPSRCWTACWPPCRRWVAGGLARDSNSVSLCGLGQA